jgi:hypothetical protein
MNYNTDFQIFVNIIEKQGWNANIANFKDIKNLLGTSLQHKPNKPDYKLTKIIFQNINLGRSPKGKFINTYNRKLHLDITFQANINKFKEIEISNSNVAFNIKIAKTDSEIETDFSIMAWHLDTEHPKDNNEFIHPLFHFHFGGHQITSNSNIDYGNILLLSPPRLMHPPLDFILAFDFIIYNFYNDEQRYGIVSHRDYEPLIKRIKKVCWKPYFTTIVEYLDGREKVGFYSGREIIGIPK